MLMLRMRVRLARLRNEDEDSVRFNFTIIHNNICFLNLYCDMIPILYYVILTFFVLQVHKLYTLVTYVNIPKGGFKGLQTENVETAE